MVKNLLANVGNVGSVPGSERFPGGGNSNPLQYSPEEPGGLRTTGPHRVRHN